MAPATTAIGRLVADAPHVQAVSDLRARVAKVEERYETLTDRTFHFIKLTDMPTGRSNIDINRVSGYLQGRLVFFLMQVRTQWQCWCRRLGNRYRRALLYSALASCMFLRHAANAVHRRTSTLLCAQRTRHQHSLTITIQQRSSLLCFPSSRLRGARSWPSSARPRR